MTRGLTLFLVLAALSASALELRVRERNGVALLHQDGLPIRGRMFWGGPTSSSVPVKAGPQRLTIRRLAPSDFDGGLTFHLRFGKRGFTRRRPINRLNALKHQSLKSHCRENVNLSRFVFR